MSFGAPQWFWGLLALPLLIALFIRAERRSTRRLRDFVSARLLPQLLGNVNRFRRALRFALQLLALVGALLALAQPRWGYTFEESKRKGIDLFLAVDTSRSMLSNDVPPNRLERVKLAAQDLLNQLQGDRVGLIAFAGRAFVQAPLTIDYDAVVEAINDLDTKTIPEGGTNISEAITLADKTYGKSAVGNRALIIFTDGEELSGDAVKTAKAAADAGARIFTIGVGTREGSLIPVSSGDGGTAFVKDSKGQVVKSKLDEKRLREIAEATGGFYLHLENGPRMMQQLFNEGIAKIQAADIDVRLSRRPIERYEWPLGAAIGALAISMLMRERKRQRARETARPSMTMPAGATVATALLLLSASGAPAAAAGLDSYKEGKFGDAYQQFQQTLKAHPQTNAADKLQFDSGAAAYKMKEYGKALESFSQALLSPDSGLQGKSHYNLANTLYQHGEAQKGDEKKLKDWNNALQHYLETLKLDPQNKEAKENYDYVKKKIEELKNKPPQQQQQKDKKQDKEDKKDQEQQQQEQNQEQSKQQQQDQQQQQQQSQDQSGSGQTQKPDKDQSQAKNSQGSDKEKEQEKSERESGASPSPSPGEKQSPAAEGEQSPAPENKKDGKKDKGESGNEPQKSSPSPGQTGDAAPSPSPDEKGENSDGSGSPSPTPAGSPKKFAGDVKGAPGEKPEKRDETAQMAEAESEKEGQLSEKQAEALLQSMKDEEARVQLDERRATHRVYNDW